jgi:hypothetical protein
MILLHGPWVGHILSEISGLGRTENWKETLMRTLLGLAAVLVVAGGAATASEPSRATSANTHGRDALTQAGPSKSVREVYICDSSSQTRRSFAREFGSAEFVSAQAAAKPQAWNAPRCMTRSEARKLWQAASR